MKIVLRTIAVLIALIVSFVFWFTIASDYGDAVASGTYRLRQNGDTSTLILRPDHTFQQDLARDGSTRHAEGTWRRLGEGGIDFSKDFLIVAGQERSPDDTAFAEMHKGYGLFVSLQLRQYHVLWYGKQSSDATDTPVGSYIGDEEGTPSTLVLKPDHTFMQDVTHNDVPNHAQGTWSVRQDGSVIFSKDFLKTSGQPLEPGETASAMDPSGGPLQIEIAMGSKSGVPTYRKKQAPW